MSPDGLCRLRVTLGALGVLAACCTIGACTIGGVHALPPLDGGPRDGDGDGGPDDGDGGDGDATPACQPGVDTDVDGVSDCAEAEDDHPFTDPAVFNGLTATIGERPEWSGTCANLDDHAEMLTRFAASTKQQKVWAGWDFDTGADDYKDPSYGFEPAWESSESGRFSVRYAGRIHFAEAGFQCFSIDIGATGTDIINGRNGCGQVYVNAGAGAGQATGWLVETGFEAASATAHTACVELPAGAHDLAVVFWYFNVFEQARLRVRRCTGAAAPCAPDLPLEPEDLHAAP